MASKSLRNLVILSVLPGVRDLPVIRVLAGPCRQIAQLCNIGFIGVRHGPYTRKRRFPRGDPGIDQPRVIDQERGHAKAG